MRRPPPKKPPRRVFILPGAERSASKYASPSQRSFGTKVTASTRDASSDTATERAVSPRHPKERVRQAARSYLDGNAALDRDWAEF